jgi:hypothetical protein
VTDKIACRICVIERGITTRDLFDTQEDFEAHLVTEHGYEIVEEEEDR